MKELTLADVGVSDVSLGMLVEERLTLLTLVSCCVVLAVVTNSPTDTSRGDKHRHVKVTHVRVLVAVAL